MCCFKNFFAIMGLRDWTHIVKLLCSPELGIFENQRHFRRFGKSSSWMKTCAIFFFLT